jgi:hypothetical protein
MYSSIDNKVRAPLLDKLYQNACLNNHLVEPDGWLKDFTKGSASYRLDFDRCSLVLWQLNSIHVMIRLNMMPTYIKTEQEANSFDFCQVLYIGGYNGLDRVLLERFNSSQQMTSECPPKLLRFRNSKDRRELTDLDKRTFDEMIQHCFEQQKTLHPESLQ